jgi:hypothetical protein
MRITLACIALAAALPSVALAESDGDMSVTAVLEEYNAKVRSGEIQQAVEGARANVEAFARLKVQTQLQREAASASFASGRAGRATAN